jgi:hypothetical protein
MCSSQLWSGCYNMCPFDCVLRLPVSGVLFPIYCDVAPRGRSIERPLLINGYAYLAVSLLDNGSVDSNS